MTKFTPVNYHIEHEHDVGGTTMTTLVRDTLTKRWSFVIAGIRYPESYANKGAAQALAEIAPEAIGAIALNVALALVPFMKR